MFYSELLLTKLTIETTGPLARVWLASNLDRKLTKQNVLQSNLEDNVKTIIGGEQAPIALRLSGQLLLGVVKIYNRKAKYLMDDCSEALLKIKMAFRPGNVDLPADQSHKANPTALMMPDTITELDLFAPLPDPEDILREPENRAPGQDPTLLDFGMSQILDSQTPTRAHQKRTLQLDDDDLGLDLGLDGGGELIRSTPMSDGPSIEMGRRAPTPRRDEPTMLEDDDLGLDFGFGADTTLGGRDGSVIPTREFNDPLNLDDDFQMGGMDEIAKDNAAALERADLRRQRDSESPLSSVRSSKERDLEKTFQLDQAELDDTDPTVVQAAQRVKRRKVVRMDAQTELQTAVLKSQQIDHSAITKAPSYLPRDPLLLQLMEMQRNGSFVSNLMGDGRMQGWAPELRGIFSLEVVRRAGDKKRKRDSGIVADISPAGSRQQTPQLEIPQDDDEGFPAGVGGANDFPDITLNDDDAPLIMSDRIDEDEEIDEMGDEVNFDITEAPLLHPSQSGAVAVETKRMVHRLRKHFAPDHPQDLNEPPTPSKRIVASALFTELCPQKATSRQEATKNFFELLVLGTKDAIKVEQQSSELGMPIRVRGKRGLWGDWAELGTAGEMGSQNVTAGGELEVGA